MIRPPRMCRTWDKGLLGMTCARKAGLIYARLLEFRALFQKHENHPEDLRQKVRCLGLWRLRWQWKARSSLAIEINKDGYQTKEQIPKILGTELMIAWTYRKRSMFLTSSEVGRWLQRESPSQVKLGVGCSGRDKFGQNDYIPDVHALRMPWVEQHGSGSPII